MTTKKELARLCRKEGARQVSEEAIERMSNLVADFATMLTLVAVNEMKASKRVRVEPRDVLDFEVHWKR
jgi:histone H3/H4